MSPPASALNMPPKWASYFLQGVSESEILLPVPASALVRSPTHQGCGWSDACGKAWGAGSAAGVKPPNTGAIAA
jgi:hypothetical protein